MVVQVKAKTDLLDIATGAIDIPVGTLGVIDGIVLPPNTVQFSVDFTGALPLSTPRWASSGELIFVDGPIGPAKAAIELAQNPEVVESIVYPNKISDRDVIIGDEFAFDKALISMTFVSGLIFEFKADINTGEIEVTLAGSVT